MNIKKAIKSKMLQKCEKCAAAYFERSLNGEYDEGCYLDKDIFKPCIYSIMPKAVVVQALRVKEKANSKKIAKAEQLEDNELEVNFIAEDELIKEFNKRGYKIWVSGKVMNIEDIVEMHGSLTGKVYSELKKHGKIMM